MPCRLWRRQDMSRSENYEKSKWKNAIWWIFFVACGACVIGHFSLIQLSNMPMSPLKLQMADVLASYVDPYFSQRWNFFAPTPIDHDVTLLARGQYLDSKTGAFVNSDW